MDQKQPYEKKSSDLPFKKILWNNFIAGISWALGATVGLSIIFLILNIISREVNFIPVIGGFISDIIDYILRHNPNLQR